MARRFEVGGDGYAEFRQAVREFVKQGKLEQARDKTLRKADHSNAIIGLFRRTSRAGMTKCQFMGDIHEFRCRYGSSSLRAP